MQTASVMNFIHGDGGRQADSTHDGNPIHDELMMMTMMSDEMRAMMNEGKRKSRRARQWREELNRWQPKKMQ